jgi:hypothetical protein
VPPRRRQPGQAALPALVLDPLLLDVLLVLLAGAGLLSGLLSGFPAGLLGGVAPSVLCEAARLSVR